MKKKYYVTDKYTDENKIIRNTIFPDTGTCLELINDLAKTPFEEKYADIARIDEERQYASSLAAVAIGGYIGEVLNNDGTAYARIEEHIFIQHGKKNIEYIPIRTKDQKLIAGLQHLGGVFTLVEPGFVKLNLGLAKIHFCDGKLIPLAYPEIETWAQNYEVMEINEWEPGDPLPKED